MTCKNFQQWLCERNASEVLNTIPEELRRHIVQCNECKKELEKAEKLHALHALLQSARAPDPGENFWEEYLTTVAARVRKKQDEVETTVIPLWTKRLLIPAAAAVILIAGVVMADQYYPVLDRFYFDEEYTSNFDILEAHDMVSAQYMLDPTPLYAMEEVIAENWEEPPIKKN